jgi:hypothetical protein
MKNTPDPSAQVPAEKLGPPGIRGHLRVVAILKNETRDTDARLHDQTPRAFKVTGRLGKLPLPGEDIRGNFTEADGSSFLVATPGASLLEVHCPEGKFSFRKNAVEELSLVDFECQTITPQEARRKFLHAVLPFIDFLAYSANNPVYVVMIRIDDIKNHVTSLEYISPHRKATVVPHAASIPPELLPVHAMYREAKNSHSDFYKFLCYHKILEGLLGNMRAALFKRAKSRGKNLTKRRDVIPHAADLDGPYKEHAGKPIKEFFDTVLTPQFRNAVAHFMKDDGSILNMSTPEHMDSYSDVIYVAELCVRTVIENFKQMVAELDGAR